uniref:Uncharacterized protein n=2 Tax=Micrurus TaxID=8634 RepID=A0A2D4L7K1_9SAUR
MLLFPPRSLEVRTLFCCPSLDGDVPQFMKLRYKTLLLTCPYICSSVLLLLKLDFFPPEFLPMKGAFRQGDKRIKLSMAVNPPPGTKGSICPCVSSSTEGPF